jgi:hypothetical protein
MSKLISLLSLLKWLYEVAVRAYQFFLDRKAERAAKAAEEAVEEYRNTPIDHSKPKEEKDRDAEAAADKFHEKLK